MNNKFEVIVNAKINQPGCGLRPRAFKSNDNRIVGGQEAIPGDW
jgi:hypothetical protein